MLSERSMKNYESVYRVAQEMSALTLAAAESITRTRLKAELIGGMLRTCPHFLRLGFGAIIPLLARREVASHGVYGDSA